MRRRHADIRYLNSMCAVYLTAFPMVMKETRSSIVLIRIAKNMRKAAGDVKYWAQIEDERQSLRKLIYISCTRPICMRVISSPSLNLSDACYTDLMCSEPIIISISVRCLSTVLSVHTSYQQLIAVDRVSLGNYLLSNRVTFPYRFYHYASGLILHLFARQIHWGNI